MSVQGKSAAGINGSGLHFLHHQNGLVSSAIVPDASSHCSGIFALCWSVGGTTAKIGEMQGSSNGQSGGGKGAVGTMDSAEQISGGQPQPKDGTPPIGEHALPTGDSTKSGSGEAPSGAASKGTGEPLCSAFPAINSVAATCTGAVLRFHKPAIGVVPCFL